MPDSISNNNNKPQHATPAADSTSFASILANVQKLREQQAGSSSSHHQHNVTTPQRQQQQPRQVDTKPIQHTRTTTTSLPSRDTPSNKRINAFNQDRSNQSNSSSSSMTQRKRHQPSSSSSGSSTLKVNKNQTGNPLLEHLQNNIPWEYVSKHMPYDYLLPAPQSNISRSISPRPVIFLSIKYHKLHPEHLPAKIKANKGTNSILLVYVDVERYDNVVEELNYVCVFEGLTMVLSWGWDECAVWIKGFLGRA